MKQHSSLTTFAELKQNLWNMELGTPLFLLPSLPTHSQFFSTVGLAWNAQTAEDFMQQPNYLITDNWITIGITETFLN